MFEQADPTTPPHPQQVVVAYDFSPSAEQALARAVDIATRAPQHVLHVVVALDARHGIAIQPTRDVTYTYADGIQRMVMDRMIQAFAGRPTASEVQFYVHARIGRPADEILMLAQEVGADLLLIGSHGKTGVERYLLGSVSERVVREAGCPVMVVRAKDYADVKLARVAEYDHPHTTFTPPHRYSYVDQRVIHRPTDWPLS